MNEAAQGLERLRVEAQSLPTALRAHTGRVVTEARRLARHYALDTARVEAAAWGHDLFRGHADDALLQAAAKLGIEAGSTARARPILLHGPVAAATAEEHWGVKDAEVLEAIRWHTTARPEMSLFAAAVFLADKIEPEKVAGDAELAAIRELAPRDPQAAVLAYLNRQMERHLRAGRVIHPASVEARNALLLRGSQSGGPQAGVADRDLHTRASSTAFRKRSDSS